MLIPATRYRDPEAALVFLRDVLGLEEHAVYRGDDGKILHVQMRLGRGLMMFGPPQDNAFQQSMVMPEEIGGRETTTIYAVVSDVAAVHRRAEAAGARILVPLEPQPQGGVSFSLADPEGHVWTFGDYDPEA
ncbi:VOC family protein [Psychromarinibacter sp. C21-152]|uniref:VOC family protein n=1 Tax=Psychromarinibacter sediminicola TaxID=3033385 RepID=A0AAE3NRT2_9RHOB|nr:VOC family protein [Psychromarinibacter sediminicola]MDF0600881.1 VOC family protein [Psychromarinibacter sediminicola]